MKMVGLMGRNKGISVRDETILRDNDSFNMLNIMLLLLAGLWDNWSGCTNGKRSRQNCM